MLYLYTYGLICVWCVCCVLGFVMVFVCVIVYIYSMLCFVCVLSVLIYKLINMFCLFLFSVLCCVPVIWFCFVRYIIIAIVVRFVTLLMCGVFWIHFWLYVIVCVVYELSSVMFVCLQFVFVCCFVFMMALVPRLRYFVMCVYVCIMHLLWLFVCDVCVTVDMLCCCVVFCVLFCVLSGWFNCFCFDVFVCV